MRLSFDALWTWIAIALPAFVALLVPLPAVDLAYQVRAGTEILATGAIPRADTWTFTVWGAQWVDQQWLAQVGLAIGHGLGGWELLAVIRAALVAFATGASLATARVRGAAPRTAAILALLGFALAAPAMALRPQLVGIALFALLLLLVAGRERWPRAYLLAPLLVVLWANVHGSFVLAPAILGYAWVSDLVRHRPSARRSLWVLVAGTLATLVNPFLFNAWGYAAGIGASGAIADQVTEWQRTSPFAMPGVLFYPSVVITLVVMARRRPASPWPDWVLAVAMAVIGAWAVRGVAWWPYVMAFLVAGPGIAAVAGAAADAVRMPRPSLVNGLVAVVLGLLIVVALPWWRPADPLTGRAGLLSYAPTGLAAALRDAAADGARVVVPQPWASWFEWAAPAPVYFIDSRFELFPVDVWADYAALQGPEAAEVLDRWAIDVLVVPSGQPVPAGWELVYEDADGQVLARRP